MQQVIPQSLCHMDHWASSTRYSHHGIKFGDVIERDQGQVEAWEMSQSLLNDFFS